MANPPSSIASVLPKHQSKQSFCVCQNTDSTSPCSESIRSHLYHKQSSRFILPITSQHLLFKFQITVRGFSQCPCYSWSLLAASSTQTPYWYAASIMCAHTHASHACVCTYININVSGQAITVTHIRQDYHWSASYRNNDIVKIIRVFRDHSNCWKQRKKIRYGINLDFFFVCFFKPFQSKFNYVTLLAETRLVVTILSPLLDAGEGNLTILSWKTKYAYNFVSRHKTTWCLGRWSNPACDRCRTPLQKVKTIC